MAKKGYWFWVETTAVLILRLRSDIVFLVERIAVSKSVTKE